MLNPVVFQDLPTLLKSRDSDGLPLVPWAMKNAFGTKHIPLVWDQRDVASGNASSSTVLHNIVAAVADLANSELISKKALYDITSLQVPQAERCYLSPSHNIQQKVDTVIAWAKTYSAVFLKPVNGGEIHNGQGVIKISYTSEDTFAVDFSFSRSTYSLHEKSLKETLIKIFSRAANQETAVTYALEQAIVSPLYRGGPWEVRSVFYRENSSQALEYLDSCVRSTQEPVATVADARFFSACQPVFQELETVTDPELAHREPNVIRERAELATERTIEMGLKCADLYTDALVEAVEFVIGHKPPRLLAMPAVFLLDTVYSAESNQVGLSPRMMEIQLGGVLNRFFEVHPANRSFFENGKKSLHSSGLADVQSWFATLPEPFPQIGRMLSVRREINEIEAQMFMSEFPV